MTRLPPFFSDFSTLSESALDNVFPGSKDDNLTDAELALGIDIAPVTPITDVM